jgi:hypothetical protein
MDFLQAGARLTRDVFDPGDISANGTDASTSTPSKRTPEDTISRMSNPTEPTTTGVPILDVTKAFHEQIIANGMPRSTAERDNNFPSSNWQYILNLKWTASFWAAYIWVASIQPSAYFRRRSRSFVAMYTLPTACQRTRQIRVSDLCSTRANKDFSEDMDMVYRSGLVGLSSWHHSTPKIPPEIYCTLLHITHKETPIHTQCSVPLGRVSSHAQIIRHPHAGGTCSII